MAVKRKLLRGVLAEIELPDGAELLSGKPRRTGESKVGVLHTGISFGRKKVTADRAHAIGRQGRAALSSNRRVERSAGRVKTSHARNSNAARGRTSGPYGARRNQGGGSGAERSSIWVAIIGALLALFALLDRLLVPSVRWVIRARANKVLDEVGQRLRLQIRPFQQTSRRTLIDRLVFDEKVQQAANEHAQTKQIPRDVVQQMIERYAREIVPAFNAYFYFRIGAWLSRKVSRLLYRVRIGYSDEAGLAAVPQNATVVFVMNHRSNMDYILAAHLAAEQAALSYASSKARALASAAYDPGEGAYSCGAGSAWSGTGACWNATSLWHRSLVNAGGKSGRRPDA